MLFIVEFHSGTWPYIGSYIVSFHTRGNNSKWSDASDTETEATFFELLRTILFQGEQKSCLKTFRSTYMIKVSAWYRKHKHMKQGKLNYQLYMICKTALLMNCWHGWVVFVHNVLIMFIMAVWALSWYYAVWALLDWVESPLEGRSLFALCIAHCLQFEHSGDFTMQSFQTMCICNPSKQCVNVHPVSQVQELP